MKPEDQNRKPALQNLDRKSFSDFIRGAGIT